MASGPITSWQIDGETVETVSDLIFLACSFPEPTVGTRMNTVLTPSQHTGDGGDPRKGRHIPELTRILSKFIWPKLWSFQESCIDVRVGP